MPLHNLHHHWLYTQFMQLPISTIFCLFVVCFSLCSFYGCHCTVQALVSIYHCGHWCYTHSSCSCLSVSFSACFLSKLCTFYGFHFTVQALVSAPPRTLTLHTLFKLLHAYQYHSVCVLFRLCSFYGFHFTVQALVSSTTTDWHYTVQAAAYHQYHFLLVCCFLKVMLFLWIPLHCPCFCVNTTTNTTHCSSACQYHSLLVCWLLHVMLFLMGATLLSVPLCQHNHQHNTLFICLSVSFSACLLLALSSALFMGATLFFLVLVSTQPLLFLV